MFVYYDGESPYWIDYYLDESFIGVDALVIDAIFGDNDELSQWFTGSIESLNESFIGIDDVIPVVDSLVFVDDDLSIYPAWFDGAIEALNDSFFSAEDPVIVVVDPVIFSDDGIQAIYPQWFDGSIEQLNESSTAPSEREPDQIPFWLTWHLYDWVQKKKKHDDEVSLKEVAKNIVELIDEKPKSKLAKQFKEAIERQQDIEKQRISTANAYAYIRNLLHTRAEYERRQRIEAELQAQFDIDEEEAILLLL